MISNNIQFSVQYDIEQHVINGRLVVKYAPDDLSFESGIQIHCTKSGSPPRMEADLRRTARNDFSYT